MLEAPLPTTRSDYPSMCHPKQRGQLRSVLKGQTTIARHQLRRDFPLKGDCTYGEFHDGTGQENGREICIRMDHGYELVALFVTSTTKSSRWTFLSGRWEHQVFISPHFPLFASIPCVITRDLDAQFDVNRSVFQAGSSCLQYLFCILLGIRGKSSWVHMYVSVI